MKSGCFGRKSRRSFWKLLALPFTLVTSAFSGSPETPPNILIILADDLGYGDVRCFNPESRIPTPSLDRLAAAGMRLVDAHSSSAVCTPTRYGLLTGRYNWRSRLKQGVLNGFSPPLLEPRRLTLPALLKQRGYATAAIGKWHLGMSWGRKDRRLESGEQQGVDYSLPVRNGPNQAGFDYFFGISASLDMPPYVFVENDLVTEKPSVEKQWIRKGPAALGFEAAEVLPEFTSKAVDYLNRRATEYRARPFFLYLALTAPHTPILPTKEWRGRSGLNAYADFVMQMDQAVGTVLEALEKQGLSKNTLVCFTSDNGCSPAANTSELEAKGHRPSFHFRGYKADIFEGGHRVPLLLSWPGHIKPGSKSEQIVCLNDLFSTCAEIAGCTIPSGAAEDSISFLNVLEGRQTGPNRRNLIHHSINGSFAIREGPWKLILCGDSGGWSDPKPGTIRRQELPEHQLYNLQTDIGEQHNVAAEHPEVVGRLKRLFQEQAAAGGSTTKQQ